MIEDDWGSKGISLRKIAVLARDRAAFDELCRGFLITHGATPHPAHAPMRTRDGNGGAGETTGEVIITAFPIRRRPNNELPFVSVGRIDGNDIALADETVSKFHAFIKETPAGFLVQDARSRNGTTVEGQVVPQRGAGPPTKLVSGHNVRFGSVTTTFLDAGALSDLARQLYGS